MTSPAERRLEDLFLNAMAVAEQVLYDGWLLRYAPHDVKRSRSVNVIAEGRLPLEDKLDHCEMFYVGQGQAPLYRVTSVEPPALDAALDGRRYRRFDESLVVAAPLQEPIDPRPGDLRFEAVDARRFAEAHAALAGLPPEAQAAHERRLTYSPLPQFRLIAWDGDILSGCALSMREDTDAGIFDVVVADSRRGKGFGRALCAYLMEQGRLWGAERAWLAVMAANDEALRLYKGLGFRECYRYWYREPEVAPLA